MNTKETNIQKLKEIVATKKIYSRNLLLTELNNRLDDNDAISLSTINIYLSESGISLNKESKYYTFNNENDKNIVLSNLLKKYVKKYKISVQKPMILGYSLEKNEPLLYGLMITCIAKYEEIVCSKLSKRINPVSYQINNKSIIFHFLDKDNVEKAYSLLTEL